MVKRTDNKRKSSNELTPVTGSKRLPTQTVGNFVQSNSWLDTPIISVTTKPKKNLKQEILNPIFSEFSNMTEDNFWKDVFLDASRGKFKKGFSFKNNVLSFKKVNKVFSIIVDNSSKEKMEEIMKFMQNYNKNMISKKDIENIQTKIDTQIEAKPLIWKNIKDKPMGEILINDYLKRVSKENKLSAEEESNLRLLVGLSLILKHIGDDEVIIEDNAIKNITCLCGEKGLYKINNEKSNNFGSKKTRGKSTGRSSCKMTDTSSLDIEDCHDKNCYTYHFNNFLNGLETETCRRIHSNSTGAKHKGVSFKKSSGDEEY